MCCRPITPLKSCTSFTKCFPRITTDPWSSSPRLKVQHGNLPQCYPSLIIFYQFFKHSSKPLSIGSVWLPDIRRAVASGEESVRVDQGFLPSLPQRRQSQLLLRRVLCQWRSVTNEILPRAVVSEETVNETRSAHMILLNTYYAYFSI